MSLHHLHLDSRRWARVRRQVFQRDQYRCTGCSGAGRLEAHHEPPLREGVDPYDVAGIVTLCRTCHIERHRPDNMTPGRSAWVDYLAELV